MNVRRAETPGFHAGIGQPADEAVADRGQRLLGRLAAPSRTAATASSATERQPAQQSVPGGALDFYREKACRIFHHYFQAL
ncbi:hypothetical protein NK553_11920 [Pseudomonas sp. ZM23]|uniref:Uncharacterized protein n=1 Tax=Pseudomonas triclosanedens TaxID=2961893 RepID=A0ABY7A6R8_9PSED|nr:hypothetical protein [Pseudomonas triclosanedens]MCP8464656.1 hypothetical protein [Pseudomonas triclosanedens]WAI52612.1 hypothetical protein OU419_06295 [Pseudomonas triclosanedens]